MDLDHGGGHVPGVVVVHGVHWKGIDEPRLQRFAATIAASGVAVIVISHNLNDVFAVADRVAILHLGRLVSTGPASDYDRQSAVEIMTTGALSDRENGARGAAATI